MLKTRLVMRTATFFGVVAGGLVLLLFIETAEASGCVPRHYPGKDSPVCVCNCTYCDTVDPIGTVGSDDVVVYTTSQSGKRLERTVMKKSAPILQTLPAIVIKLVLSTIFQEIVGFGGTLTDQAAFNIIRMGGVCSNASLEDVILRSYFDPNGGMGYTMVRLPMASNDGSSRFYTYDDSDVDDFNLTNFKLADEDTALKIPLLLQAQELTNYSLKVIGSSWSAPAWMKRCNCILGGDSRLDRALIGEPGDPYYRTWAQYFIKFLRAYKNNNISIWAVTTQNEPYQGRRVPWQSQTYSARTERDFIKYDLGPALRNSGFGHVKLYIYDDNRQPFTPDWIYDVMKDQLAAQYVSGVALHWYNDYYQPAAMLDVIHASHPELQLLTTEANGWFGVEAHPTMNFTRPSYGMWQVVVDQARDIISNLNHWVAGWIQWSMAVDTLGGPQWYRSPVDSVIVVNTTGAEFYKQPLHYAFGHFSAFIPPGSKRIGLSAQHFLPVDLPVTAFLRPDGLKVVVASNEYFNDLTVSVTAYGDTYGSTHGDGYSNYYQPLEDQTIITLKIPSRSIVTAIFR